MSSVAKPLTQREREQALDTFAQHVFKQNKSAFQPMYPWVLVRVLPKSQDYKGLLVLPEKQNKTLHEGVVLVTWKPKLFLHKHGEEVRMSGFVPGERVMFPHFAGLPIPGLDESNYRIVKEEPTYDRNGKLIDNGDTIFAKLKDNGEDPKEALVVALQRLVLWGLELRVLDTAACNHIADIILKRFILIDREQQAITMSGV